MGNATIRISALVAATLAVSSPAFAQSSPPLSVCNTQPQAAACTAVRGDRADGWAAQSRAEVMASHGMVTTSQPLAAQAGLRMLMNGGNAIDAAVASAAVLNLVEPMNTGVAGDLFAIIYVAKENKLYVLNASGMAPTGATVERFNSLGYQCGSEELGTRLRHAVLRHPHGHRSGHRLGLGRGADALRHARPSRRCWQPAIDYAENGFPISQRIANDWHLPNALPLQELLHRGSIPISVKTWYIDGKRPVAGQNLPQSRSRARLCGCCRRTASDAFYKGEVARAHHREIDRRSAAP